MTDEDLLAVLEWRFICASGPGGQNVNKVATAAQVRCAVTALHDLPPVAQDRLRELAGTRLNKDGEIVLTSDRFASQLRNRADALQRLQDLIAQARLIPKKRRPTKATKGSQQRRLTGKTVRAKVKTRRGRPDLED